MWSVVGFYLHRSSCLLVSSSQIDGGAEQWWCGSIVKLRRRKETRVERVAAKVESRDHLPSGDQRARTETNLATVFSPKQKVELCNVVTPLLSTSDDDNYPQFLSSGRNPSLPRQLALQRWHLRIHATTDVCVVPWLACTLNYSTICSMRQSMLRARLENCNMTKS